MYKSFFVVFFFVVFFVCSRRYEEFSGCLSPDLKIAYDNILFGERIGEGKTITSAQLVRISRSLWYCISSNAEVQSIRAN